MNADWIKSPNARRIFVLWADPRPAWVWSADGARLLWRNGAARHFAKRFLRRVADAGLEAVPIKGQVARLMRLAVTGRPSLSRIQFLVGSRPVAETCQCTAFRVPAGPALLIVGCLAMEGAVLGSDDLQHWPLVANGYLFLDGEGQPVGGPADELAEQIGASGSGLPEIGGEVALPESGITVTRLAAGPAGESVLLIEPAKAAQAPEPIPHRPPVELDAVEEDPWPEVLQLPDDDARRSLSALFDRLAQDAELYASLDGEPETPEVVADEVVAEFDVHAPALELPPDLSAQEEMRADLSFESAPDPGPPAQAAPIKTPPPRDPEALERVSRYNFDELSRILNDRIGADPRLQGSTGPGEGRPATPQPEGQLVNLAGDTFILNRLPLGILVFRDQQVLFANRALTEMTGYASVEELRTAGLAALFPPPAGDGESAGPINHLTQRDGTPVPVSARLQSISWQGRPALMLSANPGETRIGHEAAVQAFGELLAEARQEGFLVADRNGIVSRASARTRMQLGRTEQQLVGNTLSSLVGTEQSKALQAFLERPARFAETARPWISLRALGSDDEILLFAQGQAGIITGYFGLVRMARPAASPAGADIEPAVLARLSRGLRRPLNTIIGFADLIRSASFGSVGNERSVEYARDIKTAGEEIAILIDELDDFSRLKEGRYTSRPIELDLAPLLDSCVLRVRSQAGASRVLVRSAISEKLPRIRADRASLGQAVLNLLASAIDQTPAGGSVILSAQIEEDGSILVNVRDSADSAIDPGERFVVFRENTGREGQALAPVRSSVGLALTRSLLAVNAFSLSVDPVGGSGTLFSMTIPADNVVHEPTGSAEK